MIIQTLLGLIVLFLPGYFVCRLIVPKAELFERIILTFGLTIIINLIIGLLLSGFSYLLGIGLINLVMIIAINMIIFISVIIVEVLLK